MRAFANFLGAVDEGEGTTSKLKQTVLPKEMQVFAMFNVNRDREVGILYIGQLIPRSRSELKNPLLDLLLPS